MIQRAIGVLVACIVLAACTGNAKPRARAQRIGKLEQAIGGPHAIGRIGAGTPTSSVRNDSS